MKDTELVGCPICKGKKKLLGLGNIPTDCHQCNGIGWIESVPETAEDEFLATNELPISDELVVEKKKSGRPKKVV